VYGYPVDRTEEIIKVGTTQIYYRQCGHQNKIESIKDGRIYHRCDTTPGQSGSPIITNIKAKSYAIGMHIQSGSEEKKNNVGVHFTKEIILQLKLWDQEMRHSLIARKVEWHGLFSE